MPDYAHLNDLLACPRCDKTPLERGDDHYRCKACAIDFPFVGELPWMFAEPDAALGEWRNRLHFALQQLAHEAQRLKAELIAENHPELTRRRLELLKNANEKHRQLLKNLLLPVDVQSLDASYASHLALRTRLPTDQGLNTYYANAHRDWCWGERENDASLAQLERALAAAGTEAPGDTLVLGAGAGRLAYDIHQQLRPTRTVAVDFNPLLMFIARDVTRGEKLSLYEFPLAPKTLNDTAILRTLSAPDVVRDDFYLMFADVLRPPFAAQSFDTVVTPWLIDIVSEDLAVFAQRINRLLKPGGCWLNFGSLAFDHPQRRRRYSAEETVALVENCGFAAPDVFEADIPYMCSPASRHGRRETVLTFAARKTADLKPPARHKALPDWLVTGKEAVPLLPSFRTQALSTQIYSFIMSLIDGRRTIDDMAKLLEQQKLMSKEEAVPAIRQFLTKMYDDSQRQSGF
ncbi:MAG: methyltransferase domain-containing protein [Woeseia sp.]